MRIADKLQKRRETVGRKLLADTAEKFEAYREVNVIKNDLRDRP